MFSVAAVHELTHLFTAYLAQGSQKVFPYTPPQVTFLGVQTRVGDEGGFPREESGRWLESQLWGGWIEFYRDIDDNGCMSPYL